VEASAPSETKEEATNNRLRATDVGTLTNLGIVDSPIDKEDDGNKLGPARTL
jgi:hypothetical protein